jgi:photosystem II stability/assembly factor-like uncharacterized protein
MKHFVLGLAMAFSMTLQAQTSTDTERLQFAQEKVYSKRNSILKGIHIPNIGPTVMSGRITDLDVNPDNPSEMIVAYASGGLWYSNNNGTTFSPISDELPTLTIGDFAVNWKSKTIWLGTGEANSSRSSYAGYGLFKSTDFGKKWEYVNMSESHHISRVILDEENANRVWVAVIGHLYTQNAERGVFLTEDGGTTWKKTLFVNDSTGAIDLCRIPGTKNSLLAALWQRDRKAWNFEEGGTGSGIFRSDDGGKSWKELSSLESGFPKGPHVGRIGLTAFNEKIMYALVDDQSAKPDNGSKKNNQLTEAWLRKLSVDEFQKTPDSVLNSYLKQVGFPKKYSATQLKNEVKSGKLTPEKIADYTDNANARLFNTSAKGAALYRSNDGGTTWKKTHSEALPLYFTYGYYFGNVRVSSSNPDEVYVVGFHVMRSTNGGKSFQELSAENVHVDHHALWINPKNNQHLVNGNDGGLNISYDCGKNWIKCNNPAVGQFYAVAVDEETPFNVYGGLQDNGVWWASSNYQAGVAWHQNGKYPYQNLMGGDGMQVAIDPRNPNIVYTGYQFGNYYRINKNTGEDVYITPKHALGEKPYRFNWQTPIWLSQHNPDILYLGSNFFHRSMNQGKTWEKISGDLTQGGKAGDVAFGTITSIHESPIKFGLLAAGTDDGNVWISQDAGHHWEKHNHGLPAHKWVSRVWFSNEVTSRIYVALNGYRDDDFNSYFFVSEDFGKTWKNLNEKKLMEPVNVLKEDPNRANSLWMGTDNGLYWSHNGGTDWVPASSIPDVAVHDLAFSTKADKLLVGTHGRSLYVVDLKKVALWTPELNKKPWATFQDTLFLEEFSNEPKTAVDQPSLSLGEWTVWNHPTGTHHTSNSVWVIGMQNNKEVFRVEKSFNRGLNDVLWNSTDFPNGLKKGIYSLQFRTKDEQILGKSMLQVK